VNVEQVPKDKRYRKRREGYAASSLSTMSQSQHEEPPPISISYTLNGHRYNIPHYLNLDTDPHDLNGSERFWLVKVGKEVGLHISE
jgi:hypothetical protein